MKYEYSGNKYKDYFIDTWQRLDGKWVCEIWLNTDEHAHTMGETEDEALRKGKEYVDTK